VAVLEVQRDAGRSRSGGVDLALLSSGRDYPGALGAPSTIC
jgi:hypothetical protein